MKKIIQQGNTLYVYASKGTSITVPGFHLIDTMIMRSDCIFGRDVFLEIGIKRFWFKRIKNIILVPVL